MLSLINSTIGRPFAAATKNENSQKPKKHKKPATFKAGIITRIALVALVLLALCYTPTLANASNLPIFLHQPQGMYSREMDVQSLVSPEALQFNPMDPRPKLLYLMAEEDEEGAFAITRTSDIVEHTLKTDPKSDLARSFRSHQRKAAKGNQQSINYLKSQMVDYGIGKIIKSLDEKFDLRFKVVSTADEICKEIAAASKISNFKALILNAHADAHAGANRILLSKTQMIINYPQKPEVLAAWNYTTTDRPIKIDEHCFSGLSSDFTFSLIACETGAFETSIAYAIAKLSKRTVWAPMGKTIVEDVVFSMDIPFKSQFLRMDPNVPIAYDNTCEFLPDGFRRCADHQRPFPRDFEL